MNKKIIFSLAIALNLGFGILLPHSASADDTGVPVTTSEDIIDGEINLDDIDNSTSTNEPSTPDTTDTDTPATDATDESSESDSDLENDIDYNGTSGEPEVVCASPDEPGCEDTAIADEINPEMWPLYLSLGALGATILLVIIINLIGRRKK